MATILERIYKLTADATAAERSLSQIAKSTANVDNQFQKLGANIKAFASGVGITFVAKELVSGFLRVADAMDETLKSSQKLGISVQSLQEWQYALSLSGVESGTFATAVGKVAQGINDIATGKITDATKALRTFGVTGKDTADEALEKLVQGFSQLSDGPQKTALALEIFGKAGKDLIPLLNSGAKGIAELRREFGLLGTSFTAEDAKRAEAFNDNLTKIATNIKGLGIALVRDFLPHLERSTNALVENIKKFGFWGGLWEQYWQNVNRAYGMAGGEIDKLKQKQKELLEAGGLANILDAEDIGKQIKAIEAMQAATAEAAREDARFGRAVSRNADERIAASKKEQDAIAKAAKLKTDTDKVIADSMGAWGKAEAASRQRLRESFDADSDAYVKAAQKAVSANELQATSFRAATESMARDAKLRTEVGSLLIDEAAEWEKQTRVTVLREQELHRLLEVGTAAQQQYALAQLEILKAQGSVAAGMEKQVTELDVLTKGYNDFFQNLSSGVANASDVFKRAVQSIIAELLKIWAKKYIIEFVLKMFSGGFSGPSEGGSRQAFQRSVTPESSSSASQQALGVSSFASTTTDATATAARFTPQMPARPGSGANVQVNVHNNAGAQVDVKTSEDGSRIDIIIEKTRRALAGDLRSGGTVFSKSLETAYALGRARGA